MNLSASRKFREQAECELELLRRLLTEHTSLFEPPRSEPPSRMQILALAAVIHSFYTGVENVFKRSAQAFDGGVPQSAMWHVALLNSMSSASQSRPAVISGSLRTRLKKYLDFRHFFRHGYSFRLAWAQMEPLVLDCAGTLDQFEAELRRFFDKIAAAHTDGD